MAALSRSRRAAAGIAFLVAGALIALGIVLGYAGVAVLGFWPSLLAYLAIAAGFVILAIGSVANLAARIALIVGAVGWFVVATAPLLPGLPGPIGTIALLAAAAGGIVGSIVLYTGKEITDRSAAVFIGTTIVAAVLLLLPLIGVVDVVFFLLLSVLLAAGLIITGVLFRRVQRGR